MYRFIVSHLLCTGGCLLLCTSYLCSKIVRMTLAAPKNDKVNHGFRAAAAFFSSPTFWLLPLLLVLVGSALVMPSFGQLVRTGATYEHWSRFIVMSLLFEIAIVLIVTRVIDYILDLITTQIAYLKSLRGCLKSPEMSVFDCCRAPLGVISTALSPLKSIMPIFTWTPFHAAT